MFFAHTPRRLGNFFWDDEGDNVDGTALDNEADGDDHNDDDNEDGKDD